MYKKCFAQRTGGNTYLMHLWTDEGYQKVEWTNQAYVECGDSQSTHTGLNGESLRKVSNWKSDNSKLHFHDMTPYQKFLVEKYGTNDGSEVLSYQISNYLPYVEIPHLVLYGLIESPHTQHKLG
jgi:hypothetical protein